MSIDLPQSPLVPFKTSPESDWTKLRLSWVLAKIIISCNFPPGLVDLIRILNRNSLVKSEQVFLQLIPILARDIPSDYLNSYLFLLDT